MNIFQDILNVLRRGGAWAYSPITGENQYGLSVSTTVIALTVPKAASYGEAFVRTASVVFTRGGEAPTATKGLQADPTDIIVLDTRAKLLGFRVIRQAGADATLDVEYYERVADGTA